MSASGRSRWIGWIKVALGGLVALFVVRALGQACHDLQAKGVAWYAIRWHWALLSLACYWLGMLPMGLFWYRVLWALGETPSLARTLRAFYVSQLGKYVPGKVTVVLVRMSMLHGECHNLRLVTLSVFVETLTMMAVGAGCAAAFLLGQFLLADNRWDHLPLLGLALGLSAMAGAPTIPPLLRWGMPILSRLKGGQEPSPSAVAALNGRLLATGWLLNVPGWCCLGLSYWAALRSLPLPELADVTLLWLPRLVAAVGLSVVAGFASLLPGGAFVREWVLKALMATAIGPTAAIVSALWLRLIWLIAEGSAAAIMASRRSLGGSPVPTPPPAQTTPLSSR